MIRQKDMQVQQPMSQPTLDGYPHRMDDLKIHDDLNNTAHGGTGHFDVMQSIPGGTEKTRVTPQGDVLGGETRIGKKAMKW